MKSLNESTVDPARPSCLTNPKQNVVESLKNPCFYFFGALIVGGMILFVYAGGELSQSKDFCDMGNWERANVFPDCNVIQPDCSYYPVVNCSDSQQQQWLTNNATALFAYEAVGSLTAYYWGAAVIGIIAWSACCCCPNLSREAYASVKSGLSIFASACDASRQKDNSNAVDVEAGAASGRTAKSEGSSLLATPQTSYDGQSSSKSSGLCQWLSQCCHQNSENDSGAESVGVQLTAT